MRLRTRVLTGAVAAGLSPFGCEEQGSTETPATMEAAWGEATDVARIFRVEDRATKLIEDQKAKLAELKQQAAGKGRKVLWYDSGDKEVFAGTGGGGQQIILDAVTGAAAAGPAAGPAHQPPRPQSPADFLERVSGLDLTVVAVLHDLDLAAAFCRDTVVMHRRHLHAHGTVAGVLTAEMIDEVFEVTARVEVDDRRRVNWSRR